MKSTYASLSERQKQEFALFLTPENLHQVQNGTMTVGAAAQLIIDMYESALRSLLTDPGVFEEEYASWFRGASHRSKLNMHVYVHDRHVDQRQGGLNLSGRSSLSGKLHAYRLLPSPDNPERRQGPGNPNLRMKISPEAVREIAERLATEDLKRPVVKRRYVLRRSDTVIPGTLCRDVQKELKKTGIEYAENTIRRKLKAAGYRHSGKFALRIVNLS